MKILVVCQNYYPEPFRVDDICEKLVSRGHEVTVVTAIPTYPYANYYPGYSKKERREEIRNGVKIHRVYTAPRGKGALSRIRNYFSFPLHAKKFVKKLGPGFDVVLAYQLSPIMMAEPALYYGKRYNVPVLLYELDPWPSNLTAGGIKQNSLAYRYISRLSRKIYSSVDKVLVSSKPHISYIETLCSKHLPIDYLPQYAIEEGEYKVPVGDECRILYAGNVGQALPIEILFTAFDRARQSNPNLYLEIAGEGSAFEESKEYCKAHGFDHINFHGRLNKAQLEELSTKCRAGIVLLNHQLYSQLTVPGKVQTYLKFGFPILVADGGATKTVVEEAKAGIVVPTSDEEELVKAFIRYGKMSEEELMKFSKNGRAYYKKNMDESLFFQKLISSLEEIITKRK